MLKPAVARSVCAGPAGGPNMVVTTHRGDHGWKLAGEPGCNWPGGAPLDVYFAAANHDLRSLALAESRLRCDDDPVLLVRPTPWASAVACLHGFWTARNERLIRTAEQAVPLGASQGRDLFPRDVGVEPCLIPAGGLVTRTIKGHCQVTVEKAWSTPEVSFVEAWGSPGASHRHRWVVRVDGGRARLVAQSGGVIPQLID